MPRTGGIAVRDAAEVAVLPEDEARYGEPVLALCAPQGVDSVEGTPGEHDLDAAETEPLRLPEALVVVRRRKERIHYAGEHSSAGTLVQGHGA